MINLVVLISEVVSNAVQQARDTDEEIIVRLDIGDVVRLEVVDHAPMFEIRPARPASPRAFGWGLFLLDHIASGWGVEREGAGKKVWFELELRR